MNELKEIALQLKKINDKLEALLQEQRESNKKLAEPTIDCKIGSEGYNEGPSEK